MIENRKEKRICDVENANKAVKFLQTAGSENFKHMSDISKQT